MAGQFAETLANRAEIGQLRRQVDSLSKTVASWHSRAAALTKQFTDLETVVTRYATDCQAAKGSGRIVAPLRVTRSVGLQVPSLIQGRQKHLSEPSGRTSTGSLTEHAQDVLESAASIEPHAVGITAPSSSPAVEPEGTSSDNLSSKSTSVSPDSAAENVPAMSAVKEEYGSQQTPAKPTSGTHEVVDIDLSDDDDDTAAVPVPPPASPPPGPSTDLDCQPLPPGKHIFVSGNRVYSGPPAADSRGKTANKSRPPRSEPPAPRPPVVHPAPLPPLPSAEHKTPRSEPPVPRPHVLHPAPPLPGAKHMTPRSEPPVPRPHVLHPAPLPPLPGAKHIIPRSKPPVLPPVVHPAPLPPLPGAKHMTPCKPILALKRAEEGIHLQWKMTEMTPKEMEAAMAGYRIYAYKEEAVVRRVSSALWQEVGWGPCPSPWAAPSPSSPRTTSITSPSGPRTREISSAPSPIPPVFTLNSSICS